MDKDITITKKTIKRARTWFARALDAAGWLIILGLLGVGLVTAAGGGLLWLVSGNGTVLTLGITGGVVFCIVGTIALLLRLDRSVRHLRA